MNDDHDATTAISPLKDDLGFKKQAVLLVMTGPSSGHSVNLELKSLWTLGRSTESDIVFPEVSVSRDHCQFIRVGPSKWQVKDLGSSNGTWVNGDRIDKRELDNGDRVQLGSSTIVKFVLQDEVEMAFQRELYESATKDALTNLVSKRYFLEQLDVEFNFHRRTKKPLSLVIADIDHFKKINDTYGHLCGDYILKETGKIIQKILRKGDVGGRYGGEEMIFLLRETPLTGAKTFAERLRDLVEKHSFQFEGKSIRMTISLGAAAQFQDNYKDPLELIAAADACLYDAKRGGRNRTITTLEKS